MRHGSVVAIGQRIFDQMRRLSKAAIQGGFYLDKECVVEPVNQTAFQCPLLNKYCKSAELVFASGPLLATYSICPNVTPHISGTNTSTTNQTIFHGWQTVAQEHMFEISSIISTGFISYCTLVPGCSQSELCSTASFFNPDGTFSRQGVANCWDHLCSSYHATINPDFGGFGARFQGSNYIFSANHTLDDTFVSDAAFDCPTQPCVNGDVSSRQDLPIS